MSSAPITGAGTAYAIELLERSISYTCGRLAEVREADLPNPTPCSEWLLADLLAHMEDCLDAFLEATGGAVALTGQPTTALAHRLGAIRTKATLLLGAWTQYDGTPVAVAGVPLPGAAVAQVAALEIAVHGWDVGQSTGRPVPIPVALAQDLLPIAHALTADPDPRFAHPVAVPSCAPADRRLLGLLGRDPHRPDQDQ